MYVIKVGGSAGNDPLNVAAGFRGLGPCILIHGGSAAVDELEAAFRRSPRRIVSPSGFPSRYTDEVTIDLVTMAMAGRTNVHFVSALQAQGVNAIGLCGLDGRVLVGHRKDAIRAIAGGKVRVIRDDRSGTVKLVNAGLLNSLLESGYVPVLSPPILDDATATPLNADADRIAAKVAAAMSAQVLVLLTNVPGLLRDPQNPSSVMACVAQGDLPALIETTEGGMRKKLLAAREALASGVARVVIGDSRRPDPIHTALAGVGTVIA